MKLQIWYDNSGVPRVTFGDDGIALGADAFLLLDEHASAPGTPASGNVALYAKADGQIYAKDDAGLELPLSGYGAKFDLSFTLPTGFNGNITLVQHAGFPFTIDSAYYKTDSGTITLAIQIDGTNVTSLSGLSVTSTEGNATASGANTVSAGNTVRAVTTSNSTAVNFTVTVHCTRTGTG